MARIGIIGTGWGARVQVPQFREAGLEVVAIAGNDPARTAEVGARLAVGRAMRAWTEIVGADDIDLVSIVTPPSEHAEIAIAALEAGKHVLCEKPTAMHSAEAERMMDAASARPRQLALIDHELRLLPSWREARLRVQEIGTIRHAEFRYSSPSRSDNERPWSWWSDASRGGGVLGAVGSHALDAMRHLVGEITSVKAVLETFVKERPWEDDWRAVTSDDFAALFLRFAHGAAGIISLSAVAAVDEPTTITINGDLGALRLVGTRLDIASIGGSWTTIVDETPALVGDSMGGAFGTGTLLLGRALVRALDEHDFDALAPAARFHDGLLQQRCLDAARRSAEEPSGWIEVRRD